MVTEFTQKSHQQQKFVLQLIVVVLLIVLTAVFSVFSGDSLLSSALYRNDYALTSSLSSRKLPIYRVRRDDKKISVTFDCAWGADSTDAILSAMERYGVHCTFFAVEFWVKKYPDYLKKIIAAGHEAGTHSATHAYMSQLSEASIKSELTSSSLAISLVTGKSVELFRPPYGDYDDLLIETASSLGLYTVQWDVDSLDWKDLSAQAIAERVLKRVKSGSIILFHNNGKHTAEALPLIFSVLCDRGYTFVPVSELIYKSGYEIDAAGEQYISATT